MSIATIPISELLEDAEVYPRTHVDSQHVSALYNALESGAKLPPIIVDRRSKAIVDGWHRYRAIKRKYGVTATIEVEMRDYASRTAMLSEAVTLNSTHGRKLDVIDQVRCVNMLRKSKVSFKDISVILHIPEPKVKTLEVRIVTVPRGTNGTITGTDKIAIKRPVNWMAGTTFTTEQAKVHESLPGTNFLLVARQLKGAIQQRMVNPDDEKLMAELELLGQAIRSFFKSLAKMT